MKFTIHEAVLKYMRSCRSKEMTIKLDQLTSCWSVIREITVQTWAPRNPADFEYFIEDGLEIYVDKQIVHDGWLDISMNPVVSDMPDREIMVLGGRH